MRSILFWIVRCCRSLFKCNYLKSEKSFLSFLLLLWNLHQILNIFKKKKVVIANVLPNLTTVKYLVTAFLKNRRLRNSFESQHVKGFQTIVKSDSEHFYHTI